jgi:hypothetical protein
MVIHCVFEAINTADALFAELGMPEQKCVPTKRDSNTAIRGFVNTVQVDENLGPRVSVDTDLCRRQFHHDDGSRQVMAETTVRQFDT